MKLDLFEYETTPDGAADGGAVVDPPEPTPAEPAEPATPAAEAASSWAPTQDDWQAITQRLDQLSQAVTPAPPAAAASPQLADYFQAGDDGSFLIDPQNLQRYIDDQVKTGVQAAFDPVRPVLDQTIQDRGEQIINQQLETLLPDADASTRALARQVAEGFAAVPGVQPQHALAQAAKVVTDARALIGQSAVEQYKTSLANVGNAPSNGGSAAGAGVERAEPRSGSDGYKDVSENWIARHQGALN